MNSPDGFTLDVNSGGPEHERLVVEILYEENYVATLTREKVVGPFEIEWDKDTIAEQRCLKCPLDGFLAALDAAKARLAEDFERVPPSIFDSSCVEKPMEVADYPQRKGAEITMQYAHRLARCVVTDLIGAGLIGEADRGSAVGVAQEQIFARLAVGDIPPPTGSQ